jgi:hypothetical protein
MMGPRERRPLPQVAVTVVVSGELERPPVSAWAGAVAYGRPKLNMLAAATTTVTRRSDRTGCMV